eukprot:1160022-Pelagomonas_calceolata.AAC.3
MKDRGSLPGARSAKMHAHSMGRPHMKSAHVPQGSSCRASNLLVWLWVPYARISTKPASHQTCSCASGSLMQGSASKLLVCIRHPHAGLPSHRTCSCASGSLMQGFPRIKPARLRIKENKEVYEGEVTELTPEYTEGQGRYLLEKQSWGLCASCSKDTAAYAGKPLDTPLS